MGDSRRKTRETIVSGDEPYISDSSDDEDWKDAKEPHKRRGDSEKDSRRPTIVYGGYDPYALNPKDPATRLKKIYDDKYHQELERRREELEKERKRRRRINPEKPRPKIKRKTPVFPNPSREEFFGKKFDKIAGRDYQKAFNASKTKEKEREKNKKERDKAYDRFLKEETKKWKEGIAYKNLSDALAEKLIRNRVKERMYERGVSMRIAEREAIAKREAEERKREAEKRKHRRHKRRSLAITPPDRTNLHLLKF